MLSLPTVDITFELGDDEWVADPPQTRLYRAASVGNSWGVTSIGRGFDWDKRSDESERSDEFLHAPPLRLERSISDYVSDNKRRSRLSHTAVKLTRRLTPITIIAPHIPLSPSSSISTEPLCMEPTPLSPDDSCPASPCLSSYRRSSGSGTPASPRPHSRRRSSQQRVSLVAGRVMIAPIEVPPSPIVLPQTLQRTNSSVSIISSAVPAQPPQNQSFLGERKISEFVIEKEIGRGAYGLVKRAREIQEDGSLGSPLVIKQIIKSRILADCWKRHPKYGTIPIEIYVMSAISATSYELPAPRPWDPARLSRPLPSQHSPDTEVASDWVKGKVVKGHPNICPLLDFFEDNHYYYLVLPSSTPEQQSGEAPPSSDLFDLVESFPQGLPPHLIRSYLGQLADALCFLHAHGIVHRDVKDENVILGPSGKCILIDFGSSGLVKSGGWDTFSGTLDYAGPEILRGERYYGKEQDVWAFGVVAYVLLVGECPFMTADEAQESLGSPFANATIALDERCGDDKEREGEEFDGGGTLGDAAALVRACLNVDAGARPTFEKIMQCRFLCGKGGWA